MPRAIPARGTGTRGAVRFKAKNTTRRINEKMVCRPVDLPEFCDSLGQARQKIRRFHPESEDLAELASDNRETRAIEEAVENRA